MKDRVYLFLLIKKLTFKITATVATILLITGVILGVNKSCHKKHDSSTYKSVSTSTSDDNSTHTLVYTNTINRVNPELNSDEHKNSALINNDVDDSSLFTNSKPQKSSINTNFEDEPQYDKLMQTFLTPNNKLDTKSLASDRMRTICVGNLSLYDIASIDLGLILNSYGYIGPFDDAEKFEQLIEEIDTSINEILAYKPSMVTEDNLSFSNGEILAKFFQELSSEGTAKNQEFWDFILGSENDFSIADVV